MKNKKVLIYSSPSVFEFRFDFMKIKKHSDQIDGFIRWKFILVVIQAIPPSESKVQPEMYFFGVVREVNTIVHLMEKLFQDSLLPLVV